MTELGTPRPIRDPSLLDAVLPMATLVVLIGGSLVLFGLDALDGPIQGPAGISLDPQGPRLAGLDDVRDLRPGPTFILLSFIIYAPASVLLVISRREQGRRLFSPVEPVIMAISVIGAIVGIVALATVWITI